MSPSPIEASAGAVISIADCEQLSVGVDGACWISYHFYHGGDYRGALTGFIQPVLSDLLPTGRIRSFFFIRYQDDDGSHVRLRLLLCPDESGAVVTRLVEVAARFRGNGRKPAPPERLVRSVFELEVERYGGRAAFPHSLDFFALSSCHALDFMARYGEHPRERQIPLILCIFFWQAWGFAQSVEELRELLDYFVGWRERLQPVICRADHVFESHREAFVSLIRNEMERLLRLEENPTGEFPGLNSAASVSEASLRLLREIAGLPPESRRSIRISQMHMTANRLNLLNAEEGYITRLLLRAFDEVASCDTTLSRRTDQALRNRAPKGSGRLRDLLPLHFAALSRQTLPSQGAPSHAP
ncbi:MAG TPA: thiopeptide-type bacteriocin biosynthesis protein [Thermoanaerobaculia bacterium]|nr:thiopeptide-type bacteriocin biosynthesis protein [Thermoanaerobaculia bacterium]